MEKKSSRNRAAFQDSRKIFPLGLAATRAGTRNGWGRDAWRRANCEVVRASRRLARREARTSNWAHGSSPYGHPRTLTTGLPSLKMGDMRRKAVLAKTLFFLVVAALLLPAAICIVVAWPRCCRQWVMQPAAQALRYVALAGGVLWVLNLAAIVVVQAIDSLDRPDDEDAE